MFHRYDLGKGVRDLVLRPGTRLTPLLSLSGTRKVVRTPTNQFETTVNAEVHVPKEIIPRRNFYTVRRGENLIMT